MASVANGTFDQHINIDSPGGSLEEGAGRSETPINYRPSTETPPHWLHKRRVSYASIIDNKPPPITLEDHTEDTSSGQADAVWAKAIYIEDFVLVSGNVPSVGSFVVWHCRIDTLDGGSMVIRKRYSEFYDLRQRLLMTFPNSSGAMPPFPPKSMIYRFRPSFLEKRRIGLGYWLTCILLNPEFSSAPVTKEFIFG